MTDPIYTIEEVTDILLTSYASMLGKSTSEIDIYNVQKVGERTYKYDASVFYRASSEEQASIDLREQVSTGVGMVTSNLKGRVRERVREVRPEASEEYLESVISVTLDNQTGRFVRALLKGKSRPEFDLLTPTMHLNDLETQAKDFMEIKNVQVTKGATGITFRFTLNTDLVGKKMYWHAKLTTPDFEHDDVEAWVKTNDPNQQNGVITSFSAPVTFADKTLTSAYSTGLVPVSFDPQATYRIHIIAYFHLDQSYTTYFSQLI